MTDVMLGGVPIRLHSGAPVQQYAPIGGSTVLRRSQGAAFSASAKSLARSRAKKGNAPALTSFSSRRLYALSLGQERRSNPSTASPSGAGWRTQKRKNWAWAAGRNRYFS